jgi:hypothetical protein
MNNFIFILNLVGHGHLNKYITCEVKKFKIQRKDNFYGLIFIQVSNSRIINRIKIIINVDNQI